MCENSCSHNTFPVKVILTESTVGISSLLHRSTVEHYCGWTATPVLILRLRRRLIYRVVPNNRRMRVSLDDTSAHGSLLVAGWSVQNCVCQSTLDTTRGPGNRPLQGPPPGRPVRTDTPKPRHIGYIRSTALPELQGSKICLKISASKLGGGVSPSYVSRIQYGIATCAVCLPFCSVHSASL